MKQLLIIFLSFLFMTPSLNAQTAPDEQQITRLAKIDVYPRHFNAFVAAAKAVAQASVSQEEGVLCLFPMQVNQAQNKVYVLEVYQNQAAYQKYLQTPHFLKYKQETASMVRKLQLHTTTPLAFATLPEVMKQPKAAPEKLKKIVTVEEHFTIRSINARVMAFWAQQNGGVPPVSQAQKDLMQIVLPTPLDIEDVAQRRLAFMNQAGIDMQILSYGNGSPQNITDRQLAVSLCREANDTLAALIAAHPTRFAGFALLPMAFPDEAAKELHRAVTVLGFKGAMLSGTLNGAFFDEARFRPVFAQAAALNVPVYLHPGVIARDVAARYYADERWKGIPQEMFATAGYGWHVDSGVSLLRLILSGIFEELPQLQVISGHWGELVPFYLNRLDDQQSKTLSLPHNFTHYFKHNIYVTPSGFFSPEQLKYMVDVVGADRILYSGDYPFLIDTNTKRFLEDAPISPIDKQKIGWQNAEKLFSISNGTEPR